MNPRSPRRRISPRTKQRYRAIKNFLRRALGSSSLPNNTYSSLSVSVSDLKQKIVGIEQQLNTVSKHCQNLPCLEYNLKPTTVDSISTNIQNKANSHTKILKQPETKVLYKTAEDLFREPTVKKSISKKPFRDDIQFIETSDSQIMNQNKLLYREKRRNRENRLEPIQEQTLRRNLSAVENFKGGLMANHQTLNGSQYFDRYQEAGYSEAHRPKSRIKKGYADKLYFTSENNIHLDIDKRCGDHKNKNPKNKYLRPDLDQEFISEIIKRQYRPVKLFGRRDSDFSQFSAPVCRDQEYPVQRDIIQKGSELCSCCHGEQQLRNYSRYMCGNDLDDRRSICDTRLYSSRKHKHHSKRKRRVEDYNDSEMYDIVPVKEKTSPKSRRKFVEENILYKEVPPSPRTQRPQLNLQAQFHTEDDDEITLNKQLRYREKSPRKFIAQVDINRSNVSSEVFIHNRNFKGFHKSQVANTPKLGECVRTSNNLQSPTLTNEQVNNDISLNTQTIDTSAEKTDKTLSEIKDILQSFLIEMKKESTHCEKSNNAPPLYEQNVTETQQMNNRNSMFNNGYTCNYSNSFGQCMPPFMSPFTNPCCYPIIPVCPMNCMQNGIVVPTPSATCAACANNSKHQAFGSNESKNKNENSEEASTETQKLIKEIHKLISQNPKSIHKRECNENASQATRKQTETRILTSRSVGGSTKASRHDAQVGTKLKCFSKSCEAIGSRLNTHCAANMSYSDTVLEKESSGETTTTSSTESDESNESELIEKKKGNTFSKMIKSIFKKNKNDAIEELSESESTINFKRQKTRPPFHQNVMNYNMHGQEYYVPPPMSAYFNQPHHHQYECSNHQPCHSPRACYSPGYEQTFKHSAKYSNEHGIRSPCTSPMPPYPNYYDPHYGTASPQVPICLKEIEVKSIGTQSVRKMSLLQKFTNKMQVPATKPKESSQTPSSTQNTKEKPGKNLFDWKKLQAKVLEPNTDPFKYSYKTQKRLAEGDIKMRNAMVKKLFYKRNPFSPRNLLVRTLLGKDRSSFGEPPKMYKPRMFL